MWYKFKKLRRGRKGREEEEMKMQEDGGKVRRELTKRLWPVPVLGLQ